MSKKTKNWNQKKIIALIGTLAAVVLLVLLVLYFAVRAYTYKLTLDQAAIEPTRELIVSAAESISKDAPVEPTTGDVYFPEAKLYLPNPQLIVSITYNYYAGDADLPAELNISTDPIWNNTPLYTAKNLEEMFDAVPNYQACARGIKIVYRQLPTEETSGTELKQTVKLKNGQTAYVYQEAACPRLNDLADSMKNLQSY